MPISGPDTPKSSSFDSGRHSRHISLSLAHRVKCVKCTCANRQRYVLSSLHWKRNPEPPQAAMARKPETHTHTLDRLLTPQLLLDSPLFPSSLFIFANPSVFPRSVHTRSAAAPLSFLSFLAPPSLIPSSICVSIISEQCNATSVFLLFFFSVTVFQMFLAVPRLHNVPLLISVFETSRNRAKKENQIKCLYSGLVPSLLGKPKKKQTKNITTLCM